MHSAPRSVHAALSYAQGRPEAQLYRTAFQHFVTPILSSVGGPWQKHVWIGHQKWDPKSLAFRVWRVWALIVIMFHGICSILELKAAGSTVFAAFLSSNLSFSMEFATFCHFGAWTVHVCNKLFRLGLGSIYGWFKVYLGLVYGLFRFGWASMWGWFRVCLGFIQAWFRIYLELV